jgi:hypothetical protein
MKGWDFVTGLALTQTGAVLASVQRSSASSSVPGPGIPSGTIYQFDRGGSTWEQSTLPGRMGNSPWVQILGGASGIVAVRTADDPLSIPLVSVPFPAL